MFRRVFNVFFIFSLPWGRFFDNFFKVFLCFRCSRERFQCVFVSPERFQYVLETFLTFSWSFRASQRKRKKRFFAPQRFQYGSERFQCVFDATRRHQNAKQTKTFSIRFFSCFGCIRSEPGTFLETPWAFRRFTESPEHPGLPGASQGLPGCSPLLHP